MFYLGPNSVQKELFSSPLRGRTRACLMWEDQEKTHLAKPEASAMLWVAFPPIPKFHNYPKSASKVPWPFQSDESSSL